MTHRELVLERKRVAAEMGKLKEQQRMLDVEFKDRFDEPGEETIRYRNAVAGRVVVKEVNQTRVDTGKVKAYIYHQFGPMVGKTVLAKLSSSTSYLTRKVYLTE